MEIIYFTNIIMADRFEKDNNDYSVQLDHAGS